MERISVSIRARPLNDKEKEKGSAWRVDGKLMVQLDASGRDVDRARVDNAFGPECTTDMIYDITTKPLISQMLDGFNVTVFAYGQTSSGKTHTMSGTPVSPGIIPLAIQEVFNLMDSDNKRQFRVRVSFMEIYKNDILLDLLDLEKKIDPEMKIDPDKKTEPENKLAIKEGKNGPYVENLSEETVTAPEEVLELLETGGARRHFGATKMNETSSRSHTIFRMVVESRAVDEEADGAILASALTLVDLAGSERIAKTGAQGERLREGVAINKGLLALGNVIEKLSDGALGKGIHVPYRDSNLTRILQPSLGGNAKTAIICTITPAWCHLDESINTLRFACRAKRIVNTAVVNEVLTDAALVKRQAKQIEVLKKQLALLQEQNAPSPSCDALEPRAQPSLVDTDRRRRDAADGFDAAGAQPTEFSFQSSFVDTDRRRRDAADGFDAAGAQPMEFSFQSSFVDTDRRRRDAADGFNAAGAQPTEFSFQSSFVDMDRRRRSKCDAAGEQAGEVKAELLAARLALEKRDFEFGRLEAKVAKGSANLAEAEEQLKLMKKEIDDLKALLQEAEERAKKAEERCRSQADEIDHLTAHAAELESRRRAPLYQRKQEEEAKAAVEKAQGCEARAVAAELRARNLQAELDGLRRALVDSESTASEAVRQAEQTHTELVQRHELEVRQLEAAIKLKQESHADVEFKLWARINQLTYEKASLEEQLLRLPISNEGRPRTALQDKTTALQGQSNVQSTGSLPQGQSQKRLSGK